MATLARSFIKVPGFAWVQQLADTFAKTLDKHNVPHWCDYLNDK